MEIRDASELASQAQRTGRGARVTQLHPVLGMAGALMAVDLLEVEPGGSVPAVARAEEQVLYVVSGSGELSGAARGGTTVAVRPNTVVYLGPREAYGLRNTGGETLRVLVSTPLLVRSDRALGLAATVEPAGAPREAPAPEAPAGGPPARGLSVVEAPVMPRVEPYNGTEAGRVSELIEAPEYDEAGPPVDISRFMKRASEIPPGPRTERKPPAAEVPPEPEPPGEEPPQPEEEEEAPSNLIELLVVFDGGSRGNPGQGYGSFMVQSPNRKPVIKRQEFGENFTQSQAEYDSLIGCLEYIVERLEATSRSPDQVQLDIKTDAEQVANQLMGTFKVKDASLRGRHKRATELLERFAAWLIEVHSREESVRLLGH